MGVVVVNLHKLPKVQGVTHRIDRFELMQGCQPAGDRNTYAGWQKVVSQAAGALACVRRENKPPAGAKKAKFSSSTSSLNL